MFMWYYSQFSKILLNYLQKNHFWYSCVPRPANLLKNNSFIGTSLENYELGRFNYNFISYQQLYNAVLIFKQNFMNLTPDLFNKIFTK